MVVFDAHLHQFVTPWKFQVESSEDDDVILAGDCQAIGEEAQLSNLYLYWSKNYSLIFNYGFISYHTSSAKL